MKKFIKWLRFKFVQMKTGCGRCKKCEYFTLCKTDIFNLKGQRACVLCRHYNVCKSEIRKAAETNSRRP